MRLGRKGAIMKRQQGLFQSSENCGGFFSGFGIFTTVVVVSTRFVAAGFAQSMDDETQAAEVYRGAVELSTAAMRSGDATALKRAISLAKRATDLAPTVPDYWLLLGRLGARTGDNPALAKETEGALRNGVALNPGSAGGHLALGSFYFLQNRFKEALQEFETAVYISPELVTPPVIAAMCRAYNDRKEWARGENFFKSVVVQYPQADIARLALAVVYKQEGKTDDAESELRRVIVRSEAPDSNAQCAWEIVNNWEKETLSK
jgi:tetratricopeptide (TPR) repeat protein